ncbi:MAG: ABC transporter C-terminal domain-containing protein [Luteolibacter sp.]
MEDRIFAAEDKVTTIETRMNDPEFQLNHYEKIPAEMEKLEAARATTTALYSRWEELQAIADAAERNVAAIFAKLNRLPNSFHHDRWTASSWLRLVRSIPHWQQEIEKLGNYG